MNCLLSMVTSCDTSSGSCKNMANVVNLIDKERVAMMPIPCSVMLRNASSEHVPGQGDTSMGQLGPTGGWPRAEKHDNLYDIYKDLAMHDQEANDDGRGDSMEVGEEQRVDGASDKARVLKLETYQWMMAVANTVVL